jgi:hypothetical protein
MRKFYRLILLALLLFSLPTHRAMASESEAIQSVIAAQLEAFKRDDAANAYSYAAPIIQQIFPTEEAFIDMVRKGYPQVYRPKAYAFGTLEETGRGLTQTVTVTDQAGVHWTALYTVEKASDGSWKIAGCRIVKADIIS